MRWAIFAVVLIGGVTFLGYGFMKARAEQADASGRADQQANMPYGAVTPDDIMDTFEVNDIAGQSKFNHRIVVVGTVDKVQVDTTGKHAGRTWILFRVSRDRLLAAEAVSLEGVAALRPGERATVTCDLAGRMNTGTIAMLGCALR